MDMKAELMDCDHMDMNEGGHDDAIAIQRTPMRIMAAITMAVAVVELGIGGYAWDLTDHGYAYANYGYTGAAAGAWWAGLAAIVAGIIGVVALDKTWFISTCAISSAAFAVCVAGAAVDGVFANWHKTIKTCVNWTGGGTTDGFKYSGSALYELDSLYCYSTLSGNGARVVTTTFTKSQSDWVNVILNLVYTRFGVQAPATLSATTITTNYNFGPLYFAVVQAINTLTGALDGQPSAPGNKQCYCKSTDKDTLVGGFTPATAGTYVTATSVSSFNPLAGFNAYNQCWQINAGSRYACSNVVKDGYNMYATSCAFCVICAVMCGLMAIWSGMVTAWNPTRAGGPEAGSPSFGVPGGTVNY